MKQTQGNTAMKKLFIKSLTPLALILISVNSVNAEDTITLDFTAGPRGHILVPVAVNSGEVGDFLFDTGASKTALNRNRKNGLSFDVDSLEKTKVNRAHGVESSYYVPLAKVALGSVESNNIKAVLMDLSSTEGEDMKLAGVLGYDFFGEYDVTIDYASKTLSLSKQARGDACKAIDGEQFEFVAGRHIKTNLLVSEKTIPAVLDTGSGRSGINGIAIDLLSPGATDQFKAAKAAHGARPGQSHHGGDYFLGQARIGSIVHGNNTLATDKHINVVDLPVFQYFDMGDKPGILMGADLLKSKTVEIYYGCQKIDIS